MEETEGVFRLSDKVRRVFDSRNSGPFQKHDDVDGAGFRISLPIRAVPCWTQHTRFAGMKEHRGNARKFAGDLSRRWVRRKEPE